MTDSAGLHRLAELLDTDVSELAYLEPLDEEAVGQLHRLVHDSLAAEDERVQDALQATMRYLPRPLRGRAKKLLFPEGQR